MSDDLSARARRGLNNFVSQGTREVSGLLRREIDRARDELQRSAGQAAKGAGLATGAAAAGALGVVFGSVAVWQSLGRRIGGGPAAALVATAYAAAAVALASQARTEFERVRRTKPPKTTNDEDAGTGLSRIDD